MEMGKSGSSGGGDIIEKDSMGFSNEVLQYLFSFMDWKTLKSVRGVCQSWNKNALQLLKSKSQCVVKTMNLESWLRFISTMKNAPEVPFKNLDLEIRINARHDKIQEIFVLFGSSIKSLSILFECCGENGDYKFSLAYNDLLSILMECKNLTALFLTLESNPDAQEEFIEASNSVENLFKTVKTLSITELLSFEDSNFCMSENFLSMLVKWMPNITYILAKFSAQHQLDTFMHQFKQCRENGRLKLINALSLSKFGSDDVYFLNDHLSALAELKILLTCFEILNFFLDGGSVINRADISLNSLYDFLNSNDSLIYVKLLDGDGNSKKLPFVGTTTAKFPAMKNLVSLTIDLHDAVHMMPEETDLTKHFPKLKRCYLSTDWEDQITESFPGLNAAIWSTFKFTLVTTEGNEEKMRKMDFGHDTIDFYYKDSKYFTKIFNVWFPGIKVFSAVVSVHFGLPNLLRGLSTTNVQELRITVQCLVCDKYVGKYDKSLEDEYMSTFKYGLQQDFLDLPFPQLKSLEITTYDCSRICISYLHATNVLALLDAAPKLSSFTIVNNLKDYSGQSLCTYKK